MCPSSLTGIKYTAEGLTLRYELFVFKRLGVRKLHERIPEQVRVLPVVESPLQLIEVGVQVLDRQLVIQTKR